MSTKFPDWIEQARGVGRALRGLIRTWWTVDRVRISPHDGALLRLKTPSLLYVNGEFVEILDRRVETGTIAITRYRCRCGGSDATLSVTAVAGSRFPEAIWSCGGRQMRLDEHQVEIYG